MFSSSFIRMERAEQILRHIQPHLEHINSELSLSSVNGSLKVENGGIIVARALYKAGVRYVFTLSGGHICNYQMKNNDFSL